VPSGASTGPITVTTTSGYSATSLDHFYVGLVFGSGPAISSFSPMKGLAGQSVTINGTNFSGVPAVQFNGVNASSPTFYSSNRIVATVPSGATSGPITVRTTSGSVTSLDYYYVGSGTGPTISSFSPMNGLIGGLGQSVTINGTNFS